MFFISYLHVMAQDPYISTSSGLGQYGYLNKSAVTYARIDRNTHTNVNSLAARWYVAGSDAANHTFLYNVSGGAEWASCNNWQCSGCNSQSLITADFNSANFGGNWAAGNNAYVSIYSYYCGGASNTFGGGAGYNERTFTIVDLNTTTPSQSLGNTVVAGGCNAKVVGTFTLDVGAAAGISLQRFFIQNTGTATETQLGNTAFKLYYETATGNEVFDGTENSAQLYGDYGGDATTNNIFGHNTLNISLSGITRFYVTACDNPAITGTVNLSIINDGINLSPNNNTSFGMLRIDATSIGNAYVLPVTVIDFTATATGNTTKLNWTTSSETNTTYYNIEKSENGINFVKIGQVNATVGGSIHNYSFNDNQFTRSGYYRIKIIEQGKTSYSNTVFVKQTGANPIDVLPNPAHDFITLKGSRKGSGIVIVTATGSIKLQQLLVTDDEIVDIESLPAGSYFIKITNGSATVVKQLIVTK